MKNPINENLYDLLVVGGGPAGLTAAIYAARANMKVLVVEKEAPGGKMIKTGTIENYPGCERIDGPDLAMKMYEQTVTLGAEFKFNEVQHICKTEELIFENHLTNGEIILSKAVILASGTKENKLGIPGEEELYGKGVSYCAICDGAFYKDKTVAIVGGGYSAITEGLYLSKLVKKLYVIVRKSHFRADNESVRRLEEKKGVKFLMNTEVKKVLGTDRVEGLILYNNQTNATREIQVSALFPYIGATPLTKIVSDFKITNSLGYVEAFDDKLETSVPGLFVAGDVRAVPLRQIAIATGDGALAGQMAVEYIQALN
ncbi:thioredoxin reductase (NADPH) [Entomoplasma freundtii]|uniref:Thioredoxin reductase n=1 Tax=Entomoplasma freundtii TaxID=74700 RepID=A0A2K8NSA9_9MOLU|nr:FAD-dependent oxidoreductase [Entomoplasma freundtii]ATZ16657.1 thioredoxin reductase [Entomoplasma freundtii]TDY58176.1 thioredoxin reductase (NADPH) [Entomoplasma freundtii]